MGVTYNHYTVKIKIDNGLKYPFNLSEPMDIYLNPYKHIDPEGEIADRLKRNREDLIIRELDF